jgi:8-oxo-dGTP pyrophosphatase MutT (NUDIX family)
MTTSYGGTPEVLRVSVAAVIWDAGGRILLQKRADNGYWGLPGGHVEVGETVAAAVAREVWEETGLDVRPTRLIGVYSDPAVNSVRYAGRATVQFVNVLFACAVEGGALTLSEESTELRYYQPDALPEPMVPPHLVRIADALAGHAEAVYR